MVATGSTTARLDPKYPCRDSGSVNESHCSARVPKTRSRQLGLLRRASRRGQQADISVLLPHFHILIADVLSGVFQGRVIVGGLEFVAPNGLPVFAKDIRAIIHTCPHSGRPI